MHPLRIYLTLVIVNTASIDRYPSQQHSNAGNRQKLGQKLHSTVELSYL